MKRNWNYQHGISLIIAVMHDFCMIFIQRDMF